MSVQKRDDVWKSAGVVNYYFEGTRVGIPLALEQFDVMVRVLRAAPIPITHFLDLGCGDGILGHMVLDAFQKREACLSISPSRCLTSPASVWKNSGIA